MTGYESMPMQSMRSTSSMALPTSSSATVVSVGSGEMYAYHRDLACNYTVPSSYNQRGIVYNNTGVPRISGIITSASMVTGGVTSDETYSAKHGHVHSGPGVPEPCPNCVDNDHDGYCDICGHDMYECTCEDEYGYCRCPIECDWKAILFIAILSVLYVENRKKKSLRLA